MYPSTESISLIYYKDTLNSKIYIKTKRHYITESEGALHNTSYTHVTLFPPQKVITEAIT